MNKILGVLLVAAVLSVAGCRSKPVQPDASAGAGTQQGADTSGADSSAAGIGDTGEGTEVPGPQEGLLAKRVIYFDFDSSEIRGAGTEIVAAHARHVAGSQGLRVRLEGHTDERGSREYNIGLGERRAQTVRRALMLQGVAEGQITTVSYGEERPVAERSDEGAYSQNRRVELVQVQ
jgi:peptidoglycan-associated lipoprotein